MTRRIRSGWTHLALTLSALTILDGGPVPAADGAGKTLTGKDALGDWTTDAPEQARWINAPVELLRKLTAVHDWEIAHHEERARTYRRRASIASHGYLLDSPDERLDLHNQREHADLIGMARRMGRLRQTQD
jgi:hypothetical protein